MTGARKTWTAAAVLAAALVVALAFLPRGGVDAGPPLPAVEIGVAPVPPQPPPAARAPDRAQPATAPAAPAAGEYAVSPCDGCLNEPGALDVAETFLYHMRSKYIDVRAELYSDIAARLEAAGLPPPHETQLPKLPPGLVDAPANYSMSRRMLPQVERPGETWVVWVQEAWFRGESLESYISEDGPLPPAAASWPPLKFETYLTLDARTGEVVETRAMWPLGTRSRENLHAYGDRARQEAAKRAEHWFAKSSATP